MSLAFLVNKLRISCDDIHYNELSSNLTNSTSKTNNLMNYALWRAQIFFSSLEIVFYLFEWSGLSNLEKDRIKN